MQKFFGLRYPSVGDYTFAWNYDSDTPERILAGYRAHYKVDPVTGLARRVVHAKAHGLWHGRLTVRSQAELAQRLNRQELVQDYNYGNLLELASQLFTGTFTPGAKYDCWVRGSNGSPTVRADGWPDVRAMAVKILQVPYADKTLGDHDLIMSNYPAFLVRNAGDMAQLFQSPLRFAVGLRPIAVRWREVRNLTGSIMQQVRTPFGIRYWSQSPYLLGQYAVKYSLTPQQPNDCSLAGGNPTDRLRNAARVYLQKHDAIFSLGVQFQTNWKTMPLDDATVIWPEEESPVIELATLTIPAQTFDTPERDQLGENMSFSPWRAPRNHRPMGSVNWIRKLNYREMLRLRHEINDVDTQG